MKKIVVVGLVVLALVTGFLFSQNAGAQGPMIGRGSWWQPSTWNWGAYCPGIIGAIGTPIIPVIREATGGEVAG